MYDKTDETTVRVLIIYKIDHVALGKHQTVIPDESQSNEQIGGSRKRTNVLKFIKDSFSKLSGKGTFIS